MDYKARNPRVFLEIEALCEALEYGVVNISLTLHNKRITDMSVKGEKRLVYNQNTQREALEALVGRITAAKGAREDTDIDFTIKTKNSNIKEVIWNSSLRRNYEELDKPN